MVYKHGDIDMQIKEAIILAGGMGTRLKSVISDIPKPLAPIQGVPFLSYLMIFLKQQGIKHIILSVGYKYQLIQDVYGDSFEGIKISYAIEKEPLGTGGAILLALNATQTNNILILNGDSFINFELKSFYDFHQRNHSGLSLVLKQMTSFDRYGSVELEFNNDRIKAFNEKTFVDKGLINAGVYILKRDMFSLETFGDKFSFEKDFLEYNVTKGEFFGYKSDGYFIDIGIAEDYYRAQEELAKQIKIT